MREITKYHDTSKTVKERAKTQIIWCSVQPYCNYSFTNPSSDWYYGPHFYISGKLQYIYERSDVPSLLYYSDLYF